MEDMIEAMARNYCIASGYDPDGDDLRTAEADADWKNWMKFENDAKAVVIAIVSG